MADFELVSPYKPTGDQPQAIEKLTEGVLDGIRTQVLVGVTGSGKTFTMANVIKNVGRPTLVIAHNKTLAAQLCNEFREFFPHNRVEYLYRITIIISRRAIFPVRILISKRICRSTMRSINCAIPPRRRSGRGRIRWS